MKIDIIKMAQKETTKAYLKWRECLKRNKELRKSLALPNDDREDKKMCLQRYREYFDSTRSNMLIIKQD